MEFFKLQFSTVVSWESQSSGFAPDNVSLVRGHIYGISPMIGLLSNHVTIQLIKLTPLATICSGQEDILSNKADNCIID